MGHKLFNLLPWIFLSTLLLLFLAISFPAKTSAQRLRCSDFNIRQECTHLNGQDVDVEYPGTSCSGLRENYNCRGLTCTLETFLGCSSTTSICEYRGDGYNCGGSNANFSYCKTILEGGNGGTDSSGRVYGSIQNWPPTSSDENRYCGNYANTNPQDKRKPCDDWWGKCLQSCQGAGGGTNYQCPGAQQCDRDHQCLTDRPIVDLTTVGLNALGQITAGQNFTLAWDTYGGESCYTARESEYEPNDWTPTGDGRASRGSEERSESVPGSYKYTLVCSNSAGRAADSVYVQVVAPSATPTPTQEPGVTPTPTPAPDGTCAVNGVSSTGNNTGSATVSMAEERNRVNWFLNGNYVGTNSGPNADFTSLSNNSNYQVSATQWDSTGSNVNIDCTCTATNNCTFRTGSGGGGGGGRPPTPTPTPRAPTPPPPPPPGTGAIRFYNANCTTPYDGTDTLTVLTVAQNADGSYENDIWGSGGGHNALFYNGTSVAAGNYSHNANQGVRGCDSTEWHPVYDPGYQLNTDGTITPCGGGSGSGFRDVCEKEGDYLEPDSCDEYNNDGSYWGTSPCCKNGGTLRHVLNGDVGQCIDQNSYPNSSSPPQCFPNNNSPTTINAANNRMNLTSTRYMRRVFSVAGPAASKLKVLEVCTANDCDWQGVLNPSNPNRGQMRKNFNQGTYENYFFSDWVTSSSNESTYVYDVCVRGNTPTISGNVFLDTNGDGDRDTGEPGFGGGRVFVNGILYSADPNGNYTAADLELGGNYTVDIDPPADYRVTTGNDPTTFNNLRRNETVNFGITPIAQSWFQTMDADISALGTIISKIPMQCITPACTPQLGLPGSGGYPGIPMFGGSNPNFGYGTVSKKRWLANSRYNGDIYNYAYFQRKMPANAIAISGNVNAGDINGSQRPYTWYYSSGDLNITSTVNYGRDEKVIIFVNGNLTIKGRITIDKGTSFFATIVSGNINIDPGVSHPNQPALEGVYLADGTINTASPAQAGNDTRLYVRGSLAAPRGSINLSRDLDKSGSGIGNQTTPAEYIEYAPDLLLNFPPQLLRDNPVWEEVAP